MRSRAIRPHALGQFRDLLDATLHHPAMLRYLDNADNAAGHINENYAREIMELHTMGVGSGYTQKDVQELARILTGVGIDAEARRRRSSSPSCSRRLRPRRRCSSSIPTGTTTATRSSSATPSRARASARSSRRWTSWRASRPPRRIISRQLATYFVADNPPPALVAADGRRPSSAPTATSPRCSDTMFHSPEFKRLARDAKFKDPMHYVFSAVRLAYDDKVILNTAPIQSWLEPPGARGCTTTRRRTAIR